MPPLKRAITVVMLVLALGLQWTALQSVAWVSMVIKYSREAPFVQALVKTFDGQHPCSLCRIVTEGQKSEQKQQTKQPVKELDLCLEIPAAFQPTPLAFARHTIVHTRADARFEPPLIPPPRAI